MNKHSVGPWVYRPNPEEDGKHSHWIDAPNGIPLAEVRQYHNGKDNARLIAEAPAMLAALEDVELRCTQARLASTIGKKKDRGDFLRGELERIAAGARVAINKAKGEQ